MEYVVFEKNYLDIPEQDLPVDNLVVCHNQKSKLARKDEAEVWVVLKIKSAEEPAILLGLFPDRKYAEIFAKTLCI